jgi:hypothetical protein
MPKKPRTMDRRRFVKLVALGGAAAMAAPLGVADAASPPSSGWAQPGARRDASPGVRKEVASQEHSLAAMLATIRNYELPPGSPMAFVFTPLRSRRKER